MAYDPAYLATARNSALLYGGILLATVIALSASCEGPPTRDGDQVERLRADAASRTAQESLLERPRAISGTGSGGTGTSPGLPDPRETTSRLTTRVERLLSTDVLQSVVQRADLPQRGPGLVDAVLRILQDHRARVAAAASAESSPADDPASDEEADAPNPPLSQAERTRLLSFLQLLADDAKIRGALHGPIADELARILAPAPGWSDADRQRIYRLLARIYEQRHTVTLAQGIASADGATRRAVVEALTVFVEPVDPVALQVVTRESLRNLRMNWIGTGLSLHADRGELELVGRLDGDRAPRELAQLWHPTGAATITELARRQQAAQSALPTALALLDHESLAVRSAAVTVLRRLTGAFHRYRADADLLGRRRAILRWQIQLHDRTPPPTEPPTGS